MKSRVRLAYIVFPMASLLAISVFLANGRSCLREISMAADDISCRELLGEYVLIGHRSMRTYWIDGPDGNKTVPTRYDGINATIVNIALVNDHIIAVVARQVPGYGYYAISTHEGIVIDTNDETQFARKLNIIGIDAASIIYTDPSKAKYKRVRP